jgi:hypothetical protein
VSLGPFVFDNVFRDRHYAPFDVLSGLRGNFKVEKPEAVFVSEVFSTGLLIGQILQVNKLALFEKSQSLDYFDPLNGFRRGVAFIAG